MSNNTTSEAPVAHPPTNTPENGHPGAPPTDEELARELVELEKQFDPPEQGTIRADARWFEANLGAPVLTAYRGTYVAVLNEAVVGHGLNALQLELDVARKFNLHPQRFIVEYVPPSVSELGTGTE